MIHKTNHANVQVNGFMTHWVREFFGSKLFHGLLPY